LQLDLLSTFFNALGRTGLTWTRPVYRHADARATLLGLNFPGDFFAVGAGFLLAAGRKGKSKPNNGPGNRMSRALEVLTNTTQFAALASPRRITSEPRFR
jgi:hypothetical protein